MAVEIVKVPDLGGAEGVEVIEIAVSPGDEVLEEDTLLVLESDKASMDVPSPIAGVVKKLLVKLGDVVDQGTPIVEMEVPARAEEGIENKAGRAINSEPPSGEPRESGEPSEEFSGHPTPGNDAGEVSEQPLMLPDLGTGDEVDVVELAVSAGDQVGEGETLMTLEGDKATMDVPSPMSGKILTLTVKEGDKVTSGQQVGTIEAVVKKTPHVVSQSVDEIAGSSETAAPVQEAKDEHLPPTGPEQTDKSLLAGDGQTLTELEHKTAAGKFDQPEAPAAEVYAGPVVRQFAREMGIDLRNVKGTGVKGRIQKEDVKSYVRTALEQMARGRTAEGSIAAGAIPGIPDQDFSKFGEVEELPLSKIARLTASNMTRTWLNVPAVTQFDDADITEMESFRKSLKPEAERRGVKLTPLPFLMKACAAVLQSNPVVNRSWHSSGQKVIQKHYVHIGMAVDTPNGLVVPVIRDVDRKGIFDIAKDISELAEKARTGKLSPTEMQGGCFSISSLGTIGGRGFTPIVNAPEAAILGVSKASIQPVWNGREFEPRQLLPLSLSYDHKLVNGADAGKFLTDLVTTLGDIRRLLL